MPESRRRKKDDARPPVTPAASKPVARGPSPTWFVVVMAAFFLIGLAWIITYYVTGGGLPGQSALGGWNLLIGFGFVVVGFVLATQWR